MSAFVEKRVKTPVMKLLQSGASAKSIALAMAFGASGGIFPVPGVRFLLVMLEIYALRLNAVATMFAYYLSSPLNMVSIPLFIYYGNAFFGGDSDGAANFSMNQFMADVKADTINTLLQFRFTLLNAIYAWLVVLPVLTFALYLVLTPILRRVMPKTERADSAEKAE